MRLLIAVVLVLVLPAPALANFDAPFNGTVEVGTLPGFYESYDEAEAYWAQVPGVPTLKDACVTPPQMFLVNYDPNSNGWGIARDDAKGNPCRIWAEAHYLADTDEMSPWLRDLDRCRFTIHELGHTLTLDHKDYGDEAHVMISGTIPAVCQASYPPPPSEPWADMGESHICIPGWAYYGPESAANMYLNGERREARRLFKRWARHHRREARRYSGKAAVCF